MPKKVPKPQRILAIDIGGSRVKMLASGQVEPRRALTGPDYTPTQLKRDVEALTRDWKYEAISIGYPGQTGVAGPTCEPGNLGKGWVGFDFAAALECPVKIANDAAMQAIGSYEGGRMLFVGLGTGLGSAFIAENVVLPMELGHLPWRPTRSTLGEALGRRALERNGKRKWRETFAVVFPQLMRAFLADYGVIGGGNAKKLGQLPHGVRLGHNLAAFRGGFRLWGIEDVPVLLPSELPIAPRPHPFSDWRCV